jgi:hypothetical protein
MQSVACLFGRVSKGYQMKGLNPAKTNILTDFALCFRGNIKKVRTPRLQGLESAQIAFVDFPFRLWKPVNDPAAAGLSDPLGASQPWR